MKKVLLIIGIVFILSGCGKEIEKNVEQKSQEIETLKAQVENQQKQIDEQKQVIDSQNSQIESIKKEATASQSAVEHEAECRKLYSGLPECKSSNKIYWTKKEFDKFIKEEKEEHDASKSDLDSYKKKFKDCQAIIAKCG